MVEMDSAQIHKCRAIVMFGPASDVSGMRAGTYFQVTIDPAMVSPGGDYIRFGHHEGDEIQGWQRVDAMTVCEVLGHYDGDTYPEADLKDEPLVMRTIKK